MTSQQPELTLIFLIFFKEGKSKRAEEILDTVKEMEFLIRYSSSNFETFAPRFVPRHFTLFKSRELHHYTSPSFALFFNCDFVIVIIISNIIQYRILDHIKYFNSLHRGIVFYNEKKVFRQMHYHKTVKSLIKLSASSVFPGPTFFPRDSSLGLHF